MIPMPPADHDRHVMEVVSRDLRRYASLPAAFAYRTNRSASCTCNRNVAQNHLSIFHDPTLRAGDTVVTGERAVVFNGSSSWPLKPKDFSDFSASTRLTKAERRNVDSLVGVSYAANLLKPYAIARQQTREAPQQVAQAQIVRPATRSESVRQVYDVNPRTQPQQPPRPIRPPTIRSSRSSPRRCSRCSGRSSRSLRPRPTCRS